MADAGGRLDLEIPEINPNKANLREDYIKFLKTGEFNEGFRKTYDTLKFMEDNGINDPKIAWRAIQYESLNSNFNQKLEAEKQKVLNNAYKRKSTGLSNVQSQGDNANVRITRSDLQRYANGDPSVNLPKQWLDADGEIVESRSNQAEITMLREIF